MSQFLHSVRFRLTVWYAGVLAVALALFAVAVYVFVVRTLQTNVDAALQSYAQAESRAAIRQVHKKQLNVKKVRVPILTRSQPMAALIIMNVEGERKAVVKEGHPNPNSQPLRIAMFKGQESCGTVRPPGRALRASPLRFCTKLLYAEGKPIGGIEVIESLSGVNKALDRLRLALLLGVPFALLLAGAGGWILAGRALEPVDHITRMARSITGSDLSRRIGLARQDELGRLAGTFDEMIDRLERAFQEQRQLTADVSHELRSPLTILEAQATLALRRLRTPHEYRQVLASMQEEVERMSSMVDQLLTLARADAGEERMALEAVCPMLLAKPVVDAILPLGREKGVDLRLSGNADLWVQGDEDRLRHLISNLLDNAIRHTPSGGHVDVRISGGREQVLLMIADTGEGIAAEDLPHIFQRFYRGDRARRRGTGHSGLGLAIVKWIVDAHGGRIQVRSSLNEGTTFIVTLRRIQPPTSLLQTAM
jgi:heavy metal sensor kinase